MAQNESLWLRLGIAPSRYYTRLMDVVELSRDDVSAMEAYACGREDAERDLIDRLGPRLESEYRSISQGDSFFGDYYWPVWIGLTCASFAVSLSVLPLVYSGVGALLILIALGSIQFRWRMNYRRYIYLRMIELLGRHPRE